MSLPIEKEIAKGKSQITEAPPVLKKRKRTVRHRHISTIPPPPPPPILIPNPNPSPNPSITHSNSNNSSEDFSNVTTEEDEDLAHCLMLLSRGLTRSPKSPQKSSEKGKEIVTGYQCKTCSKYFLSFQALGGHRASHKKPKMSPEVKKTPKFPGNTSGVIKSEDDNKKKGANVKAPNNNALNSNNVRVHECAICGADFPSGQALGGHMRRHRPLNCGPGSSEAKKERNFLGFDLNMPAVQMDHPEPGFGAPSPVLEADLPTDLVLGSYSPY